MLWHGKDGVKLEQEARRLVKEEVDANVQHKNRLRRWMSKRELNESCTIVAALSKYIAVSDDQSQAVIGLLVDRLKQCTTNSDELTRHLDDLLTVSVNSRRLHLFDYHTWRCSPQAINSVLSSVISNGDLETVERILLLEFQPNTLNPSTVFALVKLDASMFHRLHARSNFNDEQLNVLCTKAAGEGNSFVLRSILKTLADVDQARWKKSPKIDQGSLLVTALAAGHHLLVSEIAAFFPEQPLQNLQALRVAVEATQAGVCVLASAIEPLFRLFVLPQPPRDQAHIQYAYQHCVDSCDFRSLWVMLNAGLTVPAPIVKGVCKTGNVEILKELLKGSIEVEDDLWSYYDSVPKSTADIIRENLLTYMSRTSTEIPCKEKVLLQTVLANQYQLTNHLLSSGASVDHNDGEILRNAVLSSNLDLITLLVSPKIKLITFETALRATDDLPFGLRCQIIRLLLEHGPQIRTDVVDHLLLRMACDTSEDADKGTLDVLYERSQHTLRRAGKSDQLVHPSVIQKCLDNKIQMQALIRSKTKTTLCGKRKTANTLARAFPQPFQPDTTEKHDTSRDYYEAAGSLDSTELVRDTLPVRLLKKHIKECEDYIADSVDWPLETITLLSGRIRVEVSEHKHLYKCMSAAVRCQQRKVFGELLKRTPYSKDWFETLPLDTISTDTEYLDAVFEHLTRAGADEDNYIETVLILFQRACTNQQFKYAAYMSTNSQYTLSISSCIQQLKLGIVSVTDISDIRILLSSTIVTQSELGELWVHLFEVRPKDLNSKVCMLLKAGYVGVNVSSMIYKEVASGSDSALISAILDDWQVPKSADLRPGFNYHSQCVIAPLNLLSSPASHPYYHVLAGALSEGIRAQRTDVCRMLFEKGAPLVFEGKSLIAEAIQYGSPASLREDHVLCIFLHANLFESDFQAVLDFALLQAIKCNRHLLVRELVEMGAETYLHDNQCWHAAMELGSVEMFRSLLSNESSQMYLSKMFDMIFAEVTFPVDDIDRKCAIMSQLYTAGFRDLECFSRALLVLSSHGMLTTSRIETLLLSGASVEYDNGSCIHSNLINGNIDEFLVMFRSCKDEEVRKSLFVYLFQQLSTLGPCCLFKSKSITETIKVLQAMLSVKAEQHHLNEALRSVARNALLDRDSVYPLGFLLTKGARFERDAAETLAKVLMLNHDEVSGLAVKTNPPVAARKDALLGIISSSLATFDLPKPTWSPFFVPTTSSSHIKVPHSVVSDVINEILTSEEHILAAQVDDFFNRIKLDSSLETCRTECAVNLEIMLTSFIGGLEQDTVLRCNRMELISTILKWLQLYGNEWYCSPDNLYYGVYSLNKASLQNILFICSEQGYNIIVKQLLELHVDPNTANVEGKSPLFLAAEGDHGDVADTLIAAGARPNDGSLHVAVCKQHPTIIDRLLMAAHSPVYPSEVFGGMTVLRAFLEYKEVDFLVPNFSATVFDLLLTVHRSMGFGALMGEITAVMEALLMSRHAFQLLETIASVFELCSGDMLDFCETEIEVEGFTYSILSLTSKWEKARLTVEQREVLTYRLADLGFKPLFYATEGDQPPDAENVPEWVLRKVAFNTKECAICTDKPESEYQIYACLCPECTIKHGWNDEIICTECLHTYLTTKMFPHDDERVRYKFPATNIPCWAAQCQSTIIPHNILQEVIDPDVFAVYDSALCQQILNSGTSMVKCATPDCAGAFWQDEHDDNDGLTIFTCPICFDNTCMECNDLYEKHDNRPCPVGLEAKKDERVKEEEILSETALKSEKRCPKCNLMYEKYYGCDHIVCGKNVYDTRVDKGCRYEFCNLCFGAWPNGHTETCLLRGHEYN